MTELRLYELYLAVTYATAPTTNVTYPTGTPVLGQSSPTVRWTHTPGDDGGNQTHYEVVAFDEDQYTAVGFTPDRHIIMGAYDFYSGVVTSGAGSVVVGPLDNFRNYRVYVRTAQTVNGSPHWAPWDYEAFATNYTPANPSAVTVAANDVAGLLTVSIVRAGSPLWVSVELERSVLIEAEGEPITDPQTGEPITDPVTGEAITDGVAVAGPWESVRGAWNVAETNVFASTWKATVGSSLVVVKDYEAPNGESVQYRARATTATGVVGAWVYSAVTSWESEPGVVHLKDVHNPALNVTLDVEEHPSPTRRMRQGVFEIADSEFVSVVSGKRLGRVGTLVAQTSTKTQALQLEDAIGNAAKLLQFPASHLSGSKYIALGDVDEIHIGESSDVGVRSWRMAYAQIARPADQTDY